MKYKGIDYKINSTSSYKVWLWSVHPARTAPILGRARSVTAARAAAARAINKRLLELAPQRQAASSHYPTHASR